MTVADVLEFKSVNASTFIAHETLRIASCLCLTSVHTPVCSPQSNSMDESLVNIFNCDYFSRMDFGDAHYVMKQLLAA